MCIIKDNSHVASCGSKWGSDLVNENAAGHDHTLTYYFMTDMMHHEFTLHLYFAFLQNRVLTCGAVFAEIGVLWL